MAASLKKKSLLQRHHFISCTTPLFSCTTPLFVLHDTTRKSDDFIGCAGEKTLAKPSKFSPSDTTFSPSDTTFPPSDTTLKISGDLIGRNRVVSMTISTALEAVGRTFLGPKEGFPPTRTGFSPTGTGFSPTETGFSSEPFRARRICSHQRANETRSGMERPGSDAASARTGMQRREEDVIDGRRGARMIRLSRCDISLTPKSQLCAIPKAVPPHPATSCARNRDAPRLNHQKQTKPRSTSPPSERLNRRCTLKRRSAAPPERRSAPSRGATLRAAGASPPSVRRAFASRISPSRESSSSRGASGADAETSAGSMPARTDSVTRQRASTASSISHRCPRHHSNVRRACDASHAAPPPSPGSADRRAERSLFDAETSAASMPVRTASFERNESVRHSRRPVAGAHARHHLSRV